MEQEVEDVFATDRRRSQHRQKEVGLFYDHQHMLQLAPSEHVSVRCVDSQILSLSGISHSRAVAFSRNIPTFAALFFQWLTLSILDCCHIVSFVVP